MPSFRNALQDIAKSSAARWLAALGAAGTVTAFAVQILEYRGCALPPWLPDLLLAAGLVSLAMAPWWAYHDLNRGATELEDERDRLLGSNLPIVEGPIELLEEWHSDTTLPAHVKEIMAKFEQPDPPPFATKLRLKLTETLAFPRLRLNCTGPVRIAGAHATHPTTGQNYATDPGRRASRWVEIGFETMPHAPAGMELVVTLQGDAQVSTLKVSAFPAETQQGPAA